jgi:hypothetical protein
LTRASESAADALEVLILASGARARSAARLQHDALTVWHINTTACDLAFQVIHNRSRVLGDAYPLRWSGASLRCAPDYMELTYTSLLLLTTGSSYLPFPQDHLPAGTTCFEHVVSDCLQNLLGPGSKAIRFGHPSQIGRPPEFPAAVKWLASQLGLPPADIYRDPRRQDGGLDVIAWRPFPDGRPGFPILLVQATLEKNFAHKVNDLNARLWGLLLGLDADPMTALAVPRTIADQDLWRELSTRSVPLDRARLSGLNSHAPSLKDPQWRAFLQSVLDVSRAALQQAEVVL